MELVSAWNGNSGDSITTRNTPSTISWDTHVWHSAWSQVCITAVWVQCISHNSLLAVMWFLIAVVDYFHCVSIINFYKLLVILHLQGYIVWQSGSYTRGRYPTLFLCPISFLSLAFSISFLHLFTPNNNNVNNNFVHSKTCPGCLVDGFFFCLKKMRDC